jgi:hypothetical protein
MSEPVPIPENVRLVRPDGTTVPLELTYEGMNEDGIHVWVAAVPVQFRRGDCLRAAVLPARTSIEVTWVG